MGYDYSLAKRFNYEDAFVKFCSGLPLSDIALMLSIPLGKLEDRARNGRWATLKDQIEAQVGGLQPAHPDDLARRCEMIQLNREKNLAAWVELRDDALDIIKQLRATRGEKMMKRYWHNRGMVVAHDCDVSMADRNALANYLAVISAGTYAALGDRISSTGAKDDATAHPGSQGVPSITIILPGVISKPRDQRQTAGNPSTPAPEEGPQAGTVIDLRTEEFVQPPA